MKYRSRLYIEAWQVSFEESPPAWVLDAIEKGIITAKGWSDGIRWYDVYCEKEDLVAYAMLGGWIIRDASGRFSCLPKDVFEELYEKY